MNRNFDTEALLKSAAGGVLPLIATNAEAVTKSNTTTFNASVVYIGTAGNVKVLTAGGQTVTFANVPNCSFLPVLVTMVYSTDTTASDFIRVW